MYNKKMLQDDVSEDDAQKKICTPSCTTVVFILYSFHHTETTMFNWNNSRDVSIYNHKLTSTSKRSCRMNYAASNLLIF